MRIFGTGILNGLRISMRNLMRGPITVQYPRERLELPERARWAVAPKYDGDGALKCTACLTCVKTCPDFVLDLEFTQDPDTKVKHIDHFNYQVGACMMCGLCVESCPYDAILMSHDYELAGTDPSHLAYDLLTDVDAAAIKRAERPAPAPKPAAPAAPAAEEPEAAARDTADATPSPAEESGAASAEEDAPSAAEEPDSPPDAGTEAAATPEEGSADE